MACGDGGGALPSKSESVQPTEQATVWKHEHVMRKRETVREMCLPRAWAEELFITGWDPKIVIRAC